MGKGKKNSTAALKRTRKAMVELAEACSRGGMVRSAVVVMNAVKSLDKAIAAGKIKSGKAG